MHILRNGLFKRRQNSTRSAWSMVTTGFRGAACGGLRAVVALAAARALFQPVLLLMLAFYSGFQANQLKSVEFLYIFCCCCIYINYFICWWSSNFQYLAYRLDFNSFFAFILSLSGGYDLQR